METNNTQPIKDALQRLITAMTNSGLEVASHLQPGLTRQEIVAAFARLGLTPSEDIIGFYEFSNGVQCNGKYDYQIALFWGYYIMPLDEAVDLYHLFRQFIEDGIEEELNEACFPFLRWEGSSYLIDFEANRMGKPCILSQEDQLGIEVAYSSLRSMIDTLAECYEQGAFTVVDGEVTEQSGPESYQIAQKHNPDVPKWNGGPSPFVRFTESWILPDAADEAIDFSDLFVQITKNSFGPAAALYMLSYSERNKGTSTYEVVIIVPEKNQLPPMAHVSKPQSMNSSSEQIINEAAKNLRENYGVIADIGSDESRAWRNKMPQYMQMLAGI